MSFPHRSIICATTYHLALRLMCLFCIESHNCINRRVADGGMSLDGFHVSKTGIGHFQMWNCIWTRSEGIKDETSWNPLPQRLARASSSLSSPPPPSCLTARGSSTRSLAGRSHSIVVQWTPPLVWSVKSMTGSTGNGSHLSTQVCRHYALLSRPYCFGAAHSVVENFPPSSW